MNNQFQELSDNYVCVAELESGESNMRLVERIICFVE
jgi:hypothetical protein